MVPTPSTGVSATEKAKPTSYTFIYKDTEYDATDYVNKHPGGEDFIKNMKEERDDFTEYFRSLHSDQAEKILCSFPVTRKVKQTAAADDFFELLKKVEHLYQPLWYKEFLIWSTLVGFLCIGLYSDNRFLSIMGFALCQVITGWEAHSSAHSRNPMIILLGSRMASLLGGFSLSWWSPKHNMHHMFTNSKYDQDIQHEYKVYLYPFLYLKWRFDSLEEAIRFRNYIDIFLILVNYAIIFSSGNVLNFVIGNLIGGFYSAFVLIGNHEREHRINDKNEMSFIDHQVITCRNYPQTNFWWLMLMGGMQFQTEHHIFPQIPFYRLPEAQSIITEHLKSKGKSIIYGPVL